MAGLQPGPPKTVCPPWIVESLADFYDVGLTAIHMVATSDEGYSLRTVEDR